MFINYYYKDQYNQGWAVFKIQLYLAFYILYLDAILLGKLCILHFKQKKKYQYKY